MHKTPRHKTGRIICAATLASAIMLSSMLFQASAVVNSQLDFEGLTTNGVPGKLVSTDFAQRGISFSPVWAIDVSSFGANFAHSGVMALAPCVGSGFENCVWPLEFSFCKEQQEVRVWIGYTGALQTTYTVVMRGYDANGNQVTPSTTTLGPSATPIPVRQSLALQAGSPKIRRVTVGFIGAEQPTPTAYNNGLLIDDIEFDNDTPCSTTCASAQAPAFSLTKPASGQIVIHNTITIEGNLSAANPGATLRIDVTGPGAGQTRTSGPYPVSPGPILIPNIGGLLFPGSNSLVFTISDCGGSYSQQRTVHYRPDVTSTRFLVIDEKSIAVRGAEVYVDGNLKGRTDQNGILIVAPAIPEGTKVIARKMIIESTTYRDYHELGSYHDWKGRWYISNLAVNDDGSLSSYEVKIGADPLAYQVVRLLKRNTLVGLNLVVSLEWDATAAELNEIKERIFDTSKRLYNATDGQVLIEQARIMDDAQAWFDTDIRILADKSFATKGKTGGYSHTNSFWPWVNHWIRLARGEGGDVITHELGHYLFGVRDEYEDDDGDPSYCTEKLKSSETPYDPNSQYASCIMNTHWNTSKFCSNRSENRHRTDTEQGNASCWQTITASFGDASKTRWIIQSPDTRGVIVGQINGGSLPLPAWTPNIVINNAHGQPLCAPTVFRVTTPDGTPVKDREVKLTDWFRTWSITQGLTDSNGEITVVGMHIGDRVNAERIGSCMVTARAEDPAANNSLQILPASYSSLQSKSPNVAQQTIIEQPRQFHVFTELRPKKRNKAEISVYVQTLSGEPLPIDQRPTVMVRSRNFRKGITVKAKYKEKRAAYVGTLRKLPKDGVLEIEVTATDRNGHSETSNGTFHLTGIDHKKSTEISSPNGQLSLRVPEKALPKGATVSIGPGTVAPPVLPANVEVVSGPYAIWWSKRDSLQRSGRLNFELPRQLGRSALAGYDRKSFTILRFNAVNKKWEDIGAIVHPAPIDIIAQQTTGFGNYVLVARRGTNASSALAGSPAR